MKFYLFMLSTGKMFEYNGNSLLLNSIPLFFILRLYFFTSIAVSLTIWNTLLLLRWLLFVLFSYYNFTFPLALRTDRFLINYYLAIIGSLLLGVTGVVKSFQIALLIVSGAILVWPLFVPYLSIIKFCKASCLMFFFYWYFLKNC